MADPGVPGDGGGAPKYYLTNFSRKLHENEDILEGGAHVSRAP